MYPPQPRGHFGRHLGVALACAIFGVVLQTELCAAQPIAETENGSDQQSSDVLAKVECVMPDGRVLPVSHTDHNAPATVKADAINCPLREGETVFIITFRKSGVLDRLTFVNENSAACGHLKIAVSNCHLPADSPAWTSVDGAIPFARKRLFNLSMLGVEAKYVKLSFHVQKPDNITGLSIDRHQLRRVATVAAN
jgi:hypothetical protein